MIKFLTEIMSQNRKSIFIVVIVFGVVFFFFIVLFLQFNSLLPRIYFYQSLKTANCTINKVIIYDYYCEIEYCKIIFFNVTLNVNQTSSENIITISGKSSDLTMYIEYTVIIIFKIRREKIFFVIMIQMINSKFFGKDQI